MRDLSPREHRVRDFVLDAPGPVLIDATGGGPRSETSGLFGVSFDSDSTWPAAAWILNARTRAVVWDLRKVHTESARHSLRHFAGSVVLPAGLYELHYGSFVGSSESTTRKNGVTTTTWSGPYVDDGSFHEFHIDLRGAARAPRSDEVADAHKAADGTIVAALHPRGPSAVTKVAFSLARSAIVELSATGEIRGDPSDYAWLLDANARHVLWRMTSENTLPAGGAAKNRKAHQTFTLTAGTYVVYFITDDSHDPAEWNAMPPLDPESWGVAIHIADPAERAAFKVVDWQPVPAGIALASIMRVRDNETRSATFSLQRATDVRIYALGEASGNQMADYAWILDLNRHVKVWTMRRAETEVAGGASKNREYDGVLRLGPGTYRVYYTADGSHAFGAWNSTAPPEPAYWGVSVWPASGHAEAGAMAVVTGGNSPSVIASLVRMGNDANAVVPFRMAADDNVRVYAIGEGTGDDMDDYAWIEDAATGRTVWQMTYGATTDAGGARKNRLFDGTVALKPGNYRLHFKSDDSHSWGHWNDDAPDDPDSWGVTVSRTSPGG
ncbi:MAG TPA: hypothetical protein VHW65_10430 [Gemmatimonadales bacterium]|nr:hypothetical protein [Gemmatimonadales bacterium]